MTRVPTQSRAARRSDDEYLDPGFGVGPLPVLDTAPVAGVVIAYQGSLLRALAADTGPLQRVPGLPGAVQVTQTDGAAVLTVGDFGFGAPAVVVAIEKLVALGVRRFITVGTAGGLQPECRSGDVVICDEAVRDDGVSRHYLDGALPSRSSPSLTLELVRALPPTTPRGRSWTIDAPFRETHDDVRRHRANGVLGVEMEVASVFAVASHREVDAAAILVISDLLNGASWRPSQDAAAVGASLQVAHAAASAALLEAARRPQ